MVDSGGLSPLRTTIVVALRTVLVLVLAMTLARPAWQQEGEGVTVAVVLDRSRSVPPQLLEEAVRWLQTAAEGPQRQPGDRIAVVQSGLDAVPSAMPDVASIIDLSGEPADISETNLFRGVELAKGLLPQETANRILVVSDGNETRGSILAAADLARHGGIPIDVLPLEYTHANEVLVDRLLAPARSRQGQAVELTVVLQSQGRATGRLVLLHNGNQLGGDIPLTLDGGTHVERVTVDLQTGGPQQFEAVFEADSPAMDALVRNNRATAVTFVDGTGAVLLITEDQQEVSAPRPLRCGHRDHDPDAVDHRQRSGAAPGPGCDRARERAPLVLQRTAGRRAACLCARHRGRAAHDRWSQFVRSRRWIDSPPSAASAVGSAGQPPDAAGALALVIHSCEMPQGNYWGRRVAGPRSSTSSLDPSASSVRQRQRHGLGVSDAAGRTRSRRRRPRGSCGTATCPSSPAMQMGLSGLKEVDAGARHVVIISDGDPQPPTRSLLQAYVDANVTCSTVLVGPHVPTQGTMQTVARPGATSTSSRIRRDFDLHQGAAGRPFAIQEGLFQPQQRAAGAGLGLIGAAGARLRSRAGEGHHSDRPDPTRSTHGGTSTRSIDRLPERRDRSVGRRVGRLVVLPRLWEQSLRWVMRPATPSSCLGTRDEDGDVVVDLEAGIGCGLPELPADPGW